MEVLRGDGSNIHRFLLDPVRRCMRAGDFTDTKRMIVLK
jgi:hypothetical protein